MATEDWVPEDSLAGFFVRHHLALELVCEARVIETAQGGLKQPTVSQAPPRGQGMIETAQGGLKQPTVSQAPPGRVGKETAQRGD